MTDGELVQLRKLLSGFASERDWDQFHTPKNLAMALAGEAGELLEIFQWLTPEEARSIMSSERAADVRDELADVLGYVIRLADVLSIDLDSALREKLARNQERYPVERSRASEGLTRRMRYATSWR